MENLLLLVQELRKLDNEKSWLEFKQNYDDPVMIGKDICALANGAALEGRNKAYFIWGIDDESHDVVGTKFNLSVAKKGNQELENWLRSMLSSNVDFEYENIILDGKVIGVMTVQGAMNTPVKFEKVEYIRVGSYTKKLMDYPSLQSRLWSKLQNTNFEENIAMQDMELKEALQKLNCDAYFDMIGIINPMEYQEIGHYLLEEDIILKQDNGKYAITNMGAILFAKRLNDFKKLSRKAIRIVEYEGINRLHMRKQRLTESGYAVSFDDVINYIEALTPSKEVIVGGIRRKFTAYPHIAIREIIANALIHQDFSITGTGPLIEIFNGRIESTNSGLPLVNVMRIIDNPPRSRNEKLASLMRRLHICEESGTGWDKIMLSCEMMHLPAPKVELFEESTRVILFSESEFADLSLEDKIWACYMHACIQYVQRGYLTNSTLRNRFGLKETYSGSISRLIKQAVEAKHIKPFDPNTSNKLMKYCPIWA